MDAVLWSTMATAVAGTLLLARLFQLRQAQKFPALAFYLAQHVLWGYALTIIPRTNQAYVWVYEASNPIEWIAAIWCVVRLLDKAFSDYPGIRTVSRWATWGATTLSVCTSLALARIFWSGSIRGKPQLFYFEVADRSVLLSLALIIVLTMGFLSRYPLRLPGNTWVSLVGFSVIFLSMAAARLIDSLAPKLASRTIDLGQVAFETCTYIAWIVLLRRQEEQKPARVIFTHAGEAELLKELDAMNGILRRAGRG
jgi:hypothetical protein